MRILVAAAAAIVMLGSASANAQSLEQTYADLCSDPAKAKSESCVALAQALVAKLQGQSGVSTATPISKSAGPDAATLAIWRKRWGVLLDMVDKEMFVVAAPGATTEVKLAVLGMGYRNKSTWKVPGEELVSTMVMADGTVQEVGGMRWDEQNQRIAVTTNGTTATSYFVAQPDGSIITETHAPSGSFRIRFYRLPDGRIQSFSEKLEAGVWVANPNGNGQSVEYSPERVAHERELVHLAERQRVQDQLRAGQEERAAKAERSAARGAMFGAVLQGLAQGVSESNTGGYAEAQANLDATVANIQYAADVERQQQALAAQQEQARAAEANRQQLAENARWVAEKEQAAAEYRSGQAEAAAAREARLQEEQQASDQRRAAAEVQRRNAEQTATLERQRLQAQAAASTDNAARGGGSPQAGGSLQVEAVAQSPRADSMPSDPNAVRQMLLACFLVHHGDFDQGKGAVFFSSTVPVTVERGKPVGGDSTGTFRRKVKSSYNKDGGTGCQTFNDAAEVQRYMQDVATSHRGHKKIDTGISPLD